ncbi:SPARC-like protein 1 [Periophthalmus magnuspinnatus]|uniref:SPARC-like protein 1 n=1 Tax=Periophthalmus magnuspinnatus TaxID=409849 RepID=UPI002436D09A|nr:SPARC-like protein 1 [Periophthalmus magnuspinnatus]
MILNSQDATAEKVHQTQLLPTLITYEANSQEQDERTTEENADSPSEMSKARAVLMSEEELEALVNTGEDTDDAESNDAQEVVEEAVEDAADQVKTTMEKTEAKQEKLFEEVESSAESETPLGLDYASDSNSLQLVKILPAKDMDEKRPVSSVDEVNAQQLDKYEEKQHDKSAQTESDKQKMKDADSVSHDATEVQNDMPVRGEEEEEEEEEEERKNNSNVQGRKRQRKQKNQRSKKHSPQKDEARIEAEPNPPKPAKEEPVQSEGNSTDNGAHKTKRRRAGKWGALVGVNPVQIRATVDLYPGSRAALAGVTQDLEASADPCDTFRCKRGKTCKLDDGNKPSCVCQVPSECPPSLNELDHVCGTDNKTYDTSCELFATKCNLEGTKKGHRLHLDYTGSCKLIPPCLDPELIQFPLRMRDWLKNVLLQLYEHDTTSPGFLTPKQRLRVKKIFESERRLHAGDHSVELLERDFEKNYHMYIYPVHWQFAQLDQHPSDRQLSHSELAPLRVPLVPMEHCTSLFFQECDSDKDKQVSFKEWTSCFGIKEEDMDTSLLF